MSNKPINVGLVGGGKGAFIVNPHQKAIHFDGTRRVTAGALFPDPKIAMEEAANWPYPIKGYGSYTEMIEANATLPDDQKLSYVVIVTPNHVHFDPAMKAIKAGIPVFCEKPLCLNLKEANALVKADKDFDFLIVPGAGHGSAESPYGRRRRADFLVRHLLGVEPRLVQE